MLNKLNRILIVMTLAGLTLLLGCGTRNATGAGEQRQPALSQLEQAEVRHSLARPQRLAGAQLALPPGVRDWLINLGQPTLPGSLAGGRSASVALPYNLPADQPYTPGDAGYIASSSDVTFPGPPFGGAEMAPAGTEFPDNFSYIIYRVDDVTETPDTLTVNFGLSLPSDIGVAVYNWAYGALGAWAPLYYGPAGGFVQVQLPSAPGFDFTNPNDDLAFVVFCLNPAQLNVSGFVIEPEASQGNYDELEDNDEFTAANPLPAFNFFGFDGNIGVGGPYDGDTGDAFTFSAATGDTVQFTASYDPAADYDGGENGLLMGIVDQLWVDTAGESGFEYVWAGSGGFLAMDPYTFDGSEVAPFYLIVITISDATPFTDYILTGSGPGGGGGDYDEVESNDDASTANPLTFPVTGFTGNAGLGGSYDGGLYDLYTFTANPGESVEFIATYDPAADFNGEFGVTLFIFDQLWWDSFGEQGLFFGATGSGGMAQIAHTFDGSEVGPFYFAFQDDNQGGGLPPTDYSFDSSGP